MTLLSLEGQVQNEVGRREYWRRFESFAGSPLYDIFVAEIEAAITQNVHGSVVDSRQQTREVLTRLEITHPDLLRNWDNEELAGLFGMTMWNVIALHPDDWCFYRTIGSDGELRGTQYWRC